MGAVVLIVGALFVSPAAAGSAADIPSSIVCGTYGGVNSAGKQAGHCASVWDNGSHLYFGHGEAWCEYSASHAVTACKGIQQSITICTETNDCSALKGGTTTRVWTCGSYGGGACPSAAVFNNFTLSFKWCNTNAFTTIRTQIEQTSGTLEDDGGIGSNLVFVSC
jgi:hypothetical protein